MRLCSLLSVLAPSMTLTWFETLWTRLDNFKNNYNTNILEKNMVKFGIADPHAGWFGRGGLTVAILKTN